jgi:SAM-dependent methyltransferase
LNTYLETRQTCPICKNNSPQSLTVLYETGYEDPELKKFLTDFYRNQGMIEYQYLEEARYTLVKCEQCGLIFQQAVPGAFLAERIYEHWISPASAFEIELTKQTVGEFWNFVTDFTKVIIYLDKPPSDISVFDFGMGWGTTLSILKSMGCKVYGNELAQSRIEYAKANGITNLSNQELESMTFDYIHAYQVFEHVHNPLEALQTLVGLLKDGGLIRISVPNGSNIEKLLPKITWSTPDSSRDFIAIDPLEHINCFTYASLVQMGEFCGLVPVKLKLPLKYQNIYQFLRATIRRPYRLIKYGQTGKIPDIVFRKVTPNNP